MAATETYGRNRQSIADLEQELYDIFQDHPLCSHNESNEPVIPGDALVDVLRTFSRNHDAVDLMTRDEEEQLTSLLASNPGIQVTPQVLIQFIAMQTTMSPRHSPEGSPPPSSAAEADYDERGRSEDRDYDGMNSRSSSMDSTATYYRSSSRGPQTPRDSVFDSGRRQRTTPLNTRAAPSSWSRRPPPSRRKSDAGHSRALSDSESVSSSSPSAYARTPGRSRAPSNPTSPTFSSPPLAKSISSPPFGATPSRPHSRAQSQPQSYFASFGGSADSYYGSSPERDLDHRQTGLMSPPPSDTSFEEEQSFHEQINSMPMPRKDEDSDSDSDIDEALLGLVMDRSAASSTVSMDMEQRLDALQRMNTDLGRKLLEAERTLQNRLAEHELELEEMQSRLEEARSELSATKREEKELRSKERQNSTQIAALESEIAKLQKSLDTARASYQSLQKQYQEQCSESERYRNTLRRRDQEIKDMQEAANLHSLEAQKWLREQATYEERIAILEGELNIAQQAQAQLDEQKQENMMLKETIDRMRFDMDELRNSANSLDKGGTGSGTASAHGSVSKSLGAELLSKMNGKWDMDDEEVEEEQSSVEIEVTPDEEDTESEDYVQTIITRTKRVASRAKRLETLKIDELKEYSDTGTQHEPDEFTSSSGTQTDPSPKILTASFSVQTEEPPVSVISVQTDPEPEPDPIPAPPVVITVEREIQTDEVQPEASSSGQTTEDDDDALASSSSTLLPPTPKAAHEHLHPHGHDLPPAYDKVTGEDLALRVANETIKTWHPGLTLPIAPLVGGISEEAVEDWKTLKEELGVECAAIDKLVEESTRAGPAVPRSPRDGSKRRKSGRFYNIYNTYVYGDPDGGSLVNGQLLICVGASALVAFLMGQAMAPQYAVPGGATYYDRAAWSSFNSMQAAGEGFSGDGTAAVWSFLGRLGGGAARTLRGWPT
ncbi:hypothetical protein L227DRAFT_107788 [Lentinus tigrinus ALCF2SS1-6]|uniref:Uncharacterized protein n=1 Tax=Lentinus tigrinus ALCF2SS1-6 TaxID=1328759 RepID=A0A5C2SAF4_9APHY|nr:hypothetical protein L227DRAFT_107788 [Lentinus tigrinus ALCF2SS1-6]